MKLLSTRARAELWRLQLATRTSGKERERLLRILTSSRVALTEDAQRDAFMEYACAAQEYRHSVAALAAFVQRHNESVSAEDLEMETHAGTKW